MKTGHYRSVKESRYMKEINDMQKRFDNERVPVNKHSLQGFKRLISLLVKQADWLSF